MRILDVILNIDGLILKDNESVEEVIGSIKVNSTYPITWEVLHEEWFND